MKRPENAELEELRIAVAAADRYFSCAAEAWVQNEAGEARVTADGTPFVGENVTLDQLAEEAGALLLAACDRWGIRRVGGILPEVVNSTEEERRRAKDFLESQNEGCPV